MKNSCIRLRSCNDRSFKVQNNLLKELDVYEITSDNLIVLEKRLYYDNSIYYGLPLEEQRKKLIAELISYGFDDIDYNTLGLDKLRTLYYKKECYSKNQNG